MPTVSSYHLVVVSSLLELHILCNQVSRSIFSYSVCSYADFLPRETMREYEEKMNISCVFFFVGAHDVIMVRCGIVEYTAVYYIWCGFIKSLVHIHLQCKIVICILNRSRISISSLY